MKKIVIGTILVLLVAVGVGVFYLVSNLDDLVKTAIETYGSEATQTTVRVDNVKIELRDGGGVIRGLKVSSPAGFAAPQAFLLGEVSTRIDLNAISKELVVIDHVTVRAPEVFFELNEAGKTNLNELKRNLTAGSGTSTKPASSAGSGGDLPKLIVRKFLFEDGAIHARVVPLDKNYELKLPKIELNNLGGQKGATPEEIARQVLTVLTDRAVAQVKKQGIDQYKKKLEGEVNKRLDAEEKKIRTKIGDQATDGLKGLLNK